MEEKTRVIVATVPEDVRDFVQAAFLEKQSTAELCAFVGSNNFGDNKEYLEDLRQSFTAKYSEFSIAFEEMCRTYAPNTNMDILHLDFITCELYYMDTLDGL